MCARTLKSGLIAVFTFGVVSSVFGQPAHGADKPLYVGTITGDSVNVRSGPSENYYVVSKLNRGAQVTVMVEEFEWCGIVPPEGCYSLIQSTLVDQTGNGEGIVNGNSVRVAAGSDFDRQKYAVQTRLDKGDKVKILGSTDDGFLKIKPPANAQVWVTAGFVKRGVASKPVATPKPQSAASQNRSAPAATPKPTAAPSANTTANAAKKNPAADGSSGSNAKPQSSASTERTVPSDQFESTPGSTWRPSATPMPGRMQPNRVTAGAAREESRKPQSSGQPGNAGSTGRTVDSSNGAATDSRDTQGAPGLDAFERDPVNEAEVVVMDDPDEADDGSATAWRPAREVEDLPDPVRIAHEATGDSAAGSGTPDVATGDFASDGTVSGGFGEDPATASRRVDITASGARTPDGGYETETTQYTETYSPGSYTDTGAFTGNSGAGSDVGQAYGDAAAEPEVDTYGEGDAWDASVLAAAEGCRVKLTLLDEQLRIEMAKPLLQRNLDVLLSEYRPIAAQPEDDFCQYYAERRVAQLDVAVESQRAVRQVRNLSTEVETARQTYESRERTEVRRGSFGYSDPLTPHYDVQGELRESMVYTSTVGPRRYRLVDPHTSIPRTLCYIEFPAGMNVNMSRYLNRRVGVHARRQFLQTGGVDPISVYEVESIDLLDTMGANRRLDTAGELVEPVRKPTYNDEVTAFRR